MLGPSVDQIVALLDERKAARNPLMESMRGVRDTYNGDVIIPLPEMDKQERPAVANLITTGLDQTAMRIASTMPSIFYPPIREGIERSEQLARQRTQANAGWWQANKLPLQMRKRARWFIGYASAPVILRPDTKWGAARWDMRNPLDTYPSVSDDVMSLTPDNVIFTYTQSRQWLKDNYPESWAVLRKDANSKPNDKVDLAEYNDGEVTVLIAMSRTPKEIWNPASQGISHVELRRVENRTGMCLAVVPSRITLDKPMGQFDSLVGLFNQQAKLTALELIAVERGIFPDTYLISREGQTASFITGPHDGRTGLVNVVKGGEVREMGTNPGVATNSAIDRIERAMRTSGGIPADMTGESQSNVRTGKRGDSIMSSTIDFQIQEAQDVFAASLQEENKRAVAIAKTYFGNERKSFYISTNGFKGNVDYVANTIFENDNNLVTYSYSGADARGLIVELGQRVGLGTLSKQTAQEIDPMVANPEQELDRVTSEVINATILESFKQQGASGAIPISDMARIANLVKSDKKTLAQAIEQVQKEAQARQAAQVAATAPEAQPGLAMPGMGAEAGTGQAPAPEQPSLTQLLSSLGGKSDGTLMQRGQVG
jgi:hypothetical protein